MTLKSDRDYISKMMLGLDVGSGRDELVVSSIEYQIEEYQEGLGWIKHGTKWKDLENAKTMYRHISKREGNYRLIEVSTTIRRKILENK